MLQRIGITVCVCLLLATAGSAQVVRFETTVGNFDMVLNPTNNTRLQAHVDNLLHYVEDNSYRGSWINRAQEGFVLQMGGFYSHTKRAPEDPIHTRPVVTIDPVRGQPQIPGLSNTIGTVSVAQQANNINSGTSSFFVNLGDNSELDSEFTVFAAIPDMTVINQIMALPQLDLSEQLGQAGSLAFIDVPRDSNQFLVMIKRAFVVSDAMTIAMANSAVRPLITESAATFAAGSSAEVNSAAGSSAALGSTAAAMSVPEAGTGVLAFVGTLLLLAFRRRTLS